MTKVAKKTFPIDCKNRSNESEALVLLAVRIKVCQNEGFNTP